MIPCAPSTSPTDRRCCPWTRRRPPGGRGVVADLAAGKTTISVAVVDDRHPELNEEFLDHQWPTDVLSFVLERGAELLDGEVVRQRRDGAAGGPALRLVGRRGIAPLRDPRRVAPGRLR